MDNMETNTVHAGKERECCNYAFRSAQKFAADPKNNKRQPCGEGTALLADTLKADLGEFCDSVLVESFEARQKAYILSNLLVFIFMLISAAGIIAAPFLEYSILYIASAIFSVLALLAHFGVFGGTSKKATGSNVYATIKPTEETTKRIILEANLDAPFNRKISRKTESLLKVLNLILIILQTAFAIVMFLNENGTLELFETSIVAYIGFITALFAIVPIVLSRTVNASASTPGCVDNLVGAYLVCGAARYMSVTETKLQNTEVDILLTGSKNANLAGVKAFCHAHANLANDIDTSVISVDSIFDQNTISVVSSNRKLGKALNEAASKSEITLLNNKPSFVKGTAKVFKKNKFSHATITSLTNDAPEFYRNMDDTIDKTSPKAIEPVMKIILETIIATDSINK